MARLAGGYASYMPEGVILAELERAVRDSGAKNIGAAMKTVHEAYRMGTVSPIEIPDLDIGCKANRARRSQQAANKEAKKAAAHIELARRVGKAGGVAPAVYNGANEVCVDAFCAGELAFTGIVDIITACVARLLGPGGPDFGELSVPGVLAADTWARETAAELIASR